jgi:membrane-bound lytic murein transglycosylase B
MRHKSFATFAFLVAALMATANPGHATPCGNGPAGFEAWKRAFAPEARTNGIGPGGISALMGAAYSAGTIRADRSQHSFKLSLEAFMAKRGGGTVAAPGRGHEVRQRRAFCLN